MSLPHPPTASSVAPVTLAARHRWLVPALFANAVGLGLVAFALLSHAGGADIRWPAVLPAAYAQAPGGGIAGGAGVYVMPAQLSPKAWGAYLLDIDAQTLLVYTYTTDPRQLQLVAARSYRYDRRLQNFNTASPSPEEVRELLDREQRRPVGAVPAPGGAVPAGTPAPVEVAPAEPAPAGTK